MGDMEPVHFDTFKSLFQQGHYRGLQHNYETCAIP